MYGNISRRSFLQGLIGALCSVLVGVRHSNPDGQGASAPFPDNHSHLMTSDPWVVAYEYDVGPPLCSTEGLVNVTVYDAWSHETAQYSPRARTSQGDRLRRRWRCDRHH
jgi:hypothetical protein